MTFRNYLIILLTITTNLTFAQMPGSKGDGKITGILIDSTAKEPVEFATLSLMKVPDLDRVIDGTMTDDKGKFEFKNLEPGQYIIKYSFIGYNNKTSEVIEIGSGSGRNVNLNQVLLQPSTQMLAEVTVTGQGAVIEERVDRLVYNADRDIIARGSDASEVLRKVPLLTVDLDGNVQIRGSSNIKVLINNKPSTIMATSVADALKQIPADQIKTVEVITSPSAKYDAEGTTGIVNIITKKNNLEGYSLGVDLGGGNRGGNLGLNGNLKFGKVGFTLGGWGNANVNPNYSEFYQEAITLSPRDTAFVSRQISEGKNKMMFGRYSLGMDYDISKTQSITAGARFGMFSFGNSQTLRIDDYNKFNNTEHLLSSSILDVSNKMPNHNWDFNLDYLNVLGPQREFSISSLYSIINSNSSFSRLPADGFEGMSFENINQSRNREFTLQSDYMMPLGKNMQFEAGLKGIFRIVESEFENLSFLGDNRFLGLGDLAYNQNIGAGYLSYTYSTPTFYTFKIGGRYEYTDISANSLGQNSEIRENLNIPAYGNFIPSVNISKTIAKNYTLKLAYNQRIQRPGLQQLNPNENQANPLRISRGNPELSPELSNNLEAGISAGIKKLYLNLSVYTRFTDNAISSLTTRFDERGEGATLTTFENVGKSQATGVNLFGNYQITPKWSLNGGFETFFMEYKGKAPGFDGISLDFNTQGWNLNGRLMTQLTLNKGWQVQGFGFMRGNSVIAQGTQSGWGHYALGFKKEFTNKKGSIGFNAQNFLKSHQKYRSSLSTFQYLQENFDLRYTRGFTVNLSYRIGKMGPDAMNNMFKRRARGVNNNDLYNSGSDQQQGQQMKK